MGFVCLHRDFIDVSSIHISRLALVLIGQDTNSSNVLAFAQFSTRHLVVDFIVAFHVVVKGAVIAAQATPVQRLNATCALWLRLWATIRALASLTLYG